MDSFEQTSSTSEPIEELIKKEFLIFKKYRLDVKDIKCLFQWWQKHKAMFPTVGLLGQQFLGIVGLQIEIERIFFLVGILTITRCRLQIVNKNWLNDHRT